MSKQCKYHITKDYVERISVEQDLDAANPRTDDESLVGEMFCLHRRYRLGDETSYQDIGGLNRAMAEAADITAEKLCEFLKNENPRNLPVPEILNPEEDEDDIFDLIRPAEMAELSGGKLVCLPLYLYDHGGISISTGSFIGRAPHADFDSGMVGVIWTTTEKLRKLRGLPETHPLEDLNKQAEEALENEVKIYDLYLRGEFYIAYIDHCYADGKWEEIETIDGITSLDGTPELEIAANEYFGKDNWVECLPEREWFTIEARLRTEKEGEYSIEATLSLASERNFFKPEDETSRNGEETTRIHYIHSKERAEKVLEQLKTMRINVKRVRASVTQGELQVYVNDQFIANFGDKIELIKEQNGFYGENISGWASVISDEEIALTMLWDPYEWLHRFGELLKIRCGIDTYLDDNMKA